MRLRNDPNAKIILENNNNIYVQDPMLFSQKWNELVFKNQNPIYLEIGSGKGNFIIENALKYPHINFIGIEKNTVVCSKIIKKYLQKTIELTNLKIINTDANKIIDLFADQEISKIFLNFSDPWPKKRHAKNRLTHPNFLNLFYEILKVGSSIEFKTDNIGLYLWTLEQLIDNKKWKIIYQTDDLYADLDHQFNLENICTEYEKKFLNENKKINKIIFVKI